MKTITLEEAHQILDECSGVIIDNDVLVYPLLAELEHSDENEFLYLGWDDDQGLSYSIKFAEGENLSVKVSGSSMFLVDTEGDECQLTILEPKQLEK